MVHRPAYGKKSKLNDEIDIKVLAQEYEKLLNKEFFFCFEKGLCVSFNFKKENFFHLLGFHKLSDTTPVKAVNEGKMSKEDFFLNILKGNIEYDSMDTSLICDLENTIVNIKDTTKRSALGEIKANRLIYFSAEKIYQILNNDPVIDYDMNESTSLIKADKIFFRLEKSKMRNINFFIGYDIKKEVYYASTFFLEMEKDSFKYKANGQEQTKLHTLSKGVRNLQNNQIESFYISWGGIRKELEVEPEYIAQKTLKKWINSSHIKSSKIIIELEEISLQTQRLIKQKEILLRKECIIKLREQYDKETNVDKREYIILQLMDYDIDITENSQVYSELTYKMVKSENDCLKKRIKSLENKLEVFQRLLPEIEELEIKEIKKAYEPYLTTECILERDFIKYLIRSQNIYKHNIKPKDILKLKQYWEKMHKISK